MSDLRSTLDAAVEVGAHAICPTPWEKAEEMRWVDAFREKARAVIEAALPVLLAELQSAAPDHPDLFAQCADGGHPAFEAGADQCHCGSRRFLAGSVHHKDGPLAQLAQMADWAENLASDPARNADWETAGKIAKNIRSVLPFLDGGLPREPSEEAIDAFEEVFYRDEPQDRIRPLVDALRAAYRIDSKSKSVPSTSKNLEPGTSPGMDPVSALETYAEHAADYLKPGLNAAVAALKERATVSNAETDSPGLGGLSDEELRWLRDPPGIFQGDPYNVEKSLAIKARAELASREGR